MSATTETEPEAAIVGRTELIELISAVIAGSAGAPTVIMLVGQAGIGKSTLLRHALGTAGAEVRVLHVVGAAPSAAAYLPVVNMLWPVWGSATELPPVLRRPLTELFDGAAPVASAPDLIAQAVLALLHAAAASGPLLIAIDDVDQFDSATRELLLGVVSRLTGSHVRAIMTARRLDTLGGIDRVLQTVTVAPLSPGQSAELLDRQAHQPDQSVRGEIVRWSRGNPLALIEYARAYAHNGSRRFHGATMTEGGTAHHPVFVNQIAGLPADTRKLLLHAAAAVGDETVDDITEAAGFAGDFSHWQPACAAEVVAFTDDGHVQFANALVRSAAYAHGHLGMRRAAHEALASVPGSTESVRAWHLAAAAPGPDESVAAALETTALASRTQGAELECARSLQRAAEMSPDRADAARRYSLAASAANFGGDLAWALSLTEVPLNEAGDPNVTGHASLTRALIHLQSSRPTEAADIVRSVLDGDRPSDGHLVLALIHAATNAAYYSGELRHRGDLRRWLDDTTVTPTERSRFPLPLPAAVADIQRAYIARYADTARAAAARPRVPDRRWFSSPPTSVEPSRRLVAGVMAYACQDSASAVAELSSALDQLRELGGLRGFTYALAPLAWSLLDTGRWADLQHLLDDAVSMSAVQPLTLMDRELNACRAQLLAMRGDVEGASAALSTAWAITPVASAPACVTEMALHRAAGWTAVASGDFALAYRRFRAMFRDDAEPAHFVVSHGGIADIAWAAARSDHAEDVRPLLNAVGRQLGTKPPIRLRLLLHQAMALSTPTDAAEHHYKLAVFDPAGEEWPVERARARLHYGEWLRRSRRPAEARPLLAAALDVFERLNAEPLAELARSELRASGVTMAAPESRDALHALTAQEKQIVALAAVGLTNREIGERLKLSPRTIASHLYHVYPKLGVSRRHELRQFTL